MKGFKGIVAKGEVRRPGCNDDHGGISSETPRKLQPFTKL